ncbi:hypothetical protein [Sphingomonas paucimobilis]|uniref:hypothetical protein n=1 Tax=Sphingomonas paucimobilis TaxID=13689 RepID=UPI0024359806|nr:hypothetical protein [Sphingomonas paucimobilis]
MSIRWVAPQVPDPRVAIGTDGIDAYDAGINAGSKEVSMSQVTLSATPKGNGFQATVTYPNGVSISSSEAFPTQAEAIEAAALKVLDLPERLTDLDRPDTPD